MQQIHSDDSGNGKVAIYQMGLDELRRVSDEETARKQVETDFTEARGRETARLHVTLKALDEAERRTLEAIDRLTAETEERANHLAHLVQSFEESSGRQISDVQSALAGRVAEVQRSVSEQVQDARSALAEQERAHYDALATQQREATERLAGDLSDVREEVVRLVDNRMNQVDASFAAVRGDVEVLKYLVMDLIKARVGRSDPDQRPR